MSDTAESIVFQPHESAKVKTTVWLMSILGALMAFTSLSTDIYLPAMPQMGAFPFTCWSMNYN